MKDGDDDPGEAEGWIPLVPGEEWVDPVDPAPPPTLGAETTPLADVDDMVYAVLDAAYRHSRRVTPELFAPAPGGSRFAGAAGDTERAARDAAFLADVAVKATKHHLGAPLHRDGNNVVRRSDLWAAVTAARFAKALLRERTVGEHLRALEQITRDAAPLLTWSARGAKLAERRLGGDPEVMLSFGAPTATAERLIVTLGGPSDRKVGAARTFLLATLPTGTKLHELRPREAEELLEWVGRASGRLPDGELPERGDLIFFFLTRVLELDVVRAHRAVRAALGEPSDRILPGAQGYRLPDDSSG
jgi:hypothetical protein